MSAVPPTATTNPDHRDVQQCAKLRHMQHRNLSHYSINSSAIGSSDVGISRPSTEAAAAANRLAVGRLKMWSGLIARNEVPGAAKPFADAKSC